MKKKWAYQCVCNHICHHLHPHIRCHSCPQMCCCLCLAYAIIRTLYVLSFMPPSMLSSLPLIHMLISNLVCAIPPCLCHPTLVHILALIRPCTHPHSPLGFGTGMGKPVVQGQGGTTGMGVVPNLVNPDQTTCLYHGVMGTSGYSLTTTTTASQSLTGKQVSKFHY
jgi:hypothetical protein